MKFSDEQRNIITLCQQNKNVIIDAVAGSGKTTTLLGIAQTCAQQKILGVLFNRSLKEETRARASALSLTNLEVHNYHALARKYYNNTICNDNGIAIVLNNNSESIRALPRWDRIVLDEVQDMNPLYFRLIMKIIHDINNPDMKITCMGDRYQSIYAFLNADTRFLTHAHEIFPIIKGEWARASLSTTYRCPPAICSFINESLLGYNRLKPAPHAKNSFPVTYIHGSPFQAHKYLFNEIMVLLHEGYKPDDIFILAPSVKIKQKDTPLKMLENVLVNEGIPIYVPNEEELDISNSPDGNPTLGKIVITTFHQSKGLEREVVIIYNFDDSYYRIYNKDADPTHLSSELYVAITRAKKHLYVLHDSKQPKLTYFDNPSDEYMRFVNARGQAIDEIPHTAQVQQEKAKPRIFRASELTNYMTAEAILEARSYLTVRTVSEPYMRIALATMIQTAPKRFEIVADLNGIAVPAIYEWRHRRKIRIASEEERLEKEGAKFADRYRLLRSQITPTQEPKIATVLELANIFSAMDSGYHYKVAQIQNYNWTTNEAIEPCMDILESNLDTDDVQYEVNIPEQVCENFSILGRVDAFSQKKSMLWEIKCTDNLEPIHEIQLGVYAWMMSRQFTKQFSSIKFHLLNIRTGECRAVSATAEDLDTMVKYIVAERTRTPEKKTDEQFINEFTVNFEQTGRNLKISTSTMPILKQEFQEPMFLDDDVVFPIKKQKEKQQEKNEVIEEPQPIQESHPIEELPQKGRVLVFDLETTGLPMTQGSIYYPPTDLDKYRTSRIVQWSWALYESDGTLVSEEDHIIKPNFAEYRIMNQQFHGITESMARVQGKEFQEVLNKWLTHVREATTIVGHNVKFDRHVLYSELHRRGFPQVVTEMDLKQWVCTMERAKELCALRAGNKLKPPKLAELMHALNVQEEVGRVFHNSKHDVHYTGKCYFAEQVLKNPCPKMYEGKHAGKTYEEVLAKDRDYVVNALAVCNIRKLYKSPLRKLANWAKPLVNKDADFAKAVKVKEDEIKAMTNF